MNRRFVPATRSPDFFSREVIWLFVPFAARSVATEAVSTWCLWPVCKTDSPSCAVAANQHECSWENEATIASSAISRLACHIRLVRRRKRYFIMALGRRRQP